MQSRRPFLLALHTESRGSIIDEADEFTTKYIYIFFLISFHKLGYVNVIVGSLILHRKVVFNALLIHYSL